MTPRELWSVDGRVWRLLATSGRLVAQLLGGTLVALDPANGRRLWSYPWTAHPLAVTDDVLFAKVGGEVHVIDVATGRPTRGFPCWDADRVDHARGGPRLVVRGRDFVYALDMVVAYDLASGQRLWRKTMPSAGVAGPIAADDKVAVISFDNGSYAVDSSTGAELWRRAAPAGRLHLTAEIVIVSGGPRLEAISRSDGTSCWEQVVDLYDWHLQDGALHGFETSPSRLSHEVRSLQDGGVVSRHRLSGAYPDASRYAGGRAVVSGEHVLFSQGKGILVAFDRSTGAYAWHYQTKGGGHPLEMTTIGDRICFGVGERLYAIGR